MVMIFRWSPDEGVHPGCMPLGAGSLTGSEAPPAPKSAYTPEMPALALLPEGAVAPVFPLTHTVLYRALVYCGLQILCVLELKVCGNPTLSRPVGTSFQTFAHFASLCYILVILTMFQNFHHYLLCCSVISDLCCYYDLLKAHVIFSIF